MPASPPSLNIFIVSNTSQGGGISGGDKIFIECARQWARQGYHVSIAVWEDGEAMCRRQGLEGVEIVLWSAAAFKPFGFAVCYVARIVIGMWKACRSSVKPDIIYSASDFWPDVLPAAILKWKYPKAVWMAGLYFFAPTPWPSVADRAYRGDYRMPTFRSVVYYFSQWPVVSYLVRRAQLMVVANDLDVDRLAAQGRSRDTCEAFYGGVDVEMIDQIPLENPPRYEGCFVGRFHRQKGVQELVQIWNKVCHLKPGARLVIIGMGDPNEERALQEAIEQFGISKHVTVLGYLDGPEKYRVLKSSRVFLHTPILDTGGMAAAEGMGCGLPVVGFDLPGYRYIYPRGMVKVPPQDLEAFAREVVHLLSDEAYYRECSHEAWTFSRQWDWRMKAQLLLDQCQRLRVIMSTSS